MAGARVGNLLKSKPFRAAAVVLLLFGLYVALGFYAAPGIVRSQAVDFVREKYGRELYARRDQDQSAAAAG